MAMSVWVWYKYDKFEWVVFGNILKLETIYEKHAILFVFPNINIDYNRHKSGDEYIDDCPIKADGWKIQLCIL